ncbi:TPA: hypothetical protein QCI12_001370 [Enterobacter roggenkampii]|uniref:hypothetical protein n=1 Tax=Enterobacter asburiae TaxID=61645 RepID=UPI0025439264|nr:hypothetical protein [Enterobacter asburiae]HCR1929919.1 hypothetical protein [Enterobacter roggenkampii]WIK29205.1 hypothetical protein OI907_21375 [Enterobacter asburiae]HDR2531236.1 hypothetical protein [Enterobacter roggenkampii]HDW0515574.1 hypothetical protein [Enterobacter asburiae]HDW1380832.1 hypothetical protein [Enterobacter asburiae]
MKIDKKLNLVTNITREDGSIVYLHVTPFPYEVVEEHCLLLGNLFTNFISQVGGLGAARVAAMMLRKKLQREQELRDEANQQVQQVQQVQQAPTIVDEIQRLTSVVWNDGGTWKTASFDAAMKQGIISPDEYREVEGEVVFFMVSSAIQKAHLIAPTVGSVIGMFGGQLVSSSVTAFRDSLLTSNPPTDTQTQNAQPETSYIPS